jgi:hypothetical protein
MGKKTFKEYDLEDDESFEKYLQVVSTNISDVIEEIEDIE